MKKLKFVITIILFLVLLVLAFQNIEPILENYVVLRANFFFINWQSQPIPLGLILPLGFFAGILLMFFYNFFTDFRLRKEIRSLNKELKAYQNENDYEPENALLAGSGSGQDMDS